MTPMSRLAVLLLATAFAMVLHLSPSVPTALAASDTEAQNPDLAVTLSVPDQAAIGDTVAATISISNTSPKIQMIVVTGIWTEPSGESTVQTKNGLLLP